MKTEKILSLFFIVGLIFKLLHFPGGSVLTILALGILSVIYFPFGFYFLSGKTLQQQNIGLSLATGMALSVSIIGILFRAMHWPGAVVMQMAGFVSALPLIFVIHSLRKKEHPIDLDEYYRLLNLRLIVINAVAVFFFLLSLTSFRI